MLGRETVQFFEVMVKNPQLQIICAITSIVIFLLFYNEFDLQYKIALIAILVFSISAFIFTIIEHIRKKKEKIKKWNSLSREENQIVMRFIEGETKTIDFSNCFKNLHGSIKLLIDKKILCSEIIEEKGGRFHDPKNHVNMHDDAFEFFKRKYKK